MSLVAVENLRVAFAHHAGLVEAVRGVDFHLEDGESLGIVGESGSGKTVSCLALLRLLDPRAQVSADRLEVTGQNILTASNRTMTSIRGHQAAMIFQDPMTAFDPMFTIGHQIVETIRTHRPSTGSEARAEAQRLLEAVEMANAGAVLSYYPHQLSGGMLQRAMIAMALSCRPKLLIADEPTTALDVTIQAQILQLIKRLQRELGMGLIMITHDLGVVAETVDRVMVMYGGQVMEEGKVEQIFDAPAHSYTRSLLDSIVPPKPQQAAPSDETAAPAIAIRSLSKTYTLKRRSGWRQEYVSHRAVADVSLTLPKGSIVGLVGESGSGKSTTGLLAMRLIDPTGGRILIGDMDIASLGASDLKQARRQMQIVFQDSYSALDPMMTLAQIIAEPLHIHGMHSRAEQIRQALDWLEKVGLDRSFGGRYPHELSGGQRQRVAIARALILRPSILIADEPTSALDVSVKAQIIDLLRRLQHEMGLSILFISHDLSVVRSLTQSVAVMYKGRIVEQGPTEALFSNPAHPYTRALLDAIPVTHPRLRRHRTFLKPEDIEAGIPRQEIAARGGATASDWERKLVAIGPGHQVETYVPKPVEA